MGLDGASPYPLLGILQEGVTSRDAPCNEAESLEAHCVESTNGVVMGWGASSGVVDDVVHGGGCPRC